MFLVGLTGGIASGKSTVAALLHDLGCTVIDADLIARQVVEPGTAGWRRIKLAFGDDILLLDGSIDRARLGDIIFSDAVRRGELNAIVHPLVRRRMLYEVFINVLKGKSYVILDVPLLLESQTFPKMMSEIIVVYCDRDTQKHRLMWRNNLSESAAQKRIDAQMSLEQKRSMATHHLCLIDNSSDIDTTRKQVDLLKAFLDNSWRHYWFRGCLLLLTSLSIYALYKIVF